MTYLSQEEEFVPSCLDASIINECRKLKDIKLKRILSESQRKLLFPHDGGSNASTFDVTLMVAVLRNLTSIYVNFKDALPIDDDISKSADMAVGRLGGQRIVAECQELRTKTLNTQDHLNQILEEWKMNESKLDTTLRNVLEGIQTCVVIHGSCNTGKSYIIRHVASKLANEGYDIVPVSDQHEITSLIHTCGFCTRTVYVVDGVSQKMDIVRYESITKWCSPSEIILIDCEDFNQNCFRLKKSENRRNVMLNIKTVKKQGGNFAHLDHRKAENFAIMKMYNYNETKNKHLSLLIFEKAIYRQRSFDEYSIESTDRTTKEICRITLRHKSDLHGCSKTSPFDKISTLQKLFNYGTKANCVENRRDKHILQNEGKNMELNKCYKNADLPLKENHVLLERVAKIEKYCDQLFAFVTSSVQYSEDQKLWLEMQTENLLNTAYKRICQLLATSDGNDGLCSEPLTVVNDDDEVCGVSVQIGDGAFEEQYHFSKQQLIECQMCIDQNNALYWCNNCRMNICSFCKMYHETVWTVMNHEVHPLHLLS